MAKLALLSQERIIFQTKPHVLILLYEISLILVVMVVSALVLPGFEVGGIPFDLFLFFILLFAGAMLFLDWWLTRFYLTNIRVIKTRGIIGKNSVSIPLEKIQDISYRFGILGRIFGFGDLMIESAGNLGNISFRYIPSPWTVRAKIQECIQKQKNSKPSWE
jgi:uncharacterized membrane protein YdbT with pleckstrin-like domain